MREILFRGKTKNGEWVCGAYFCLRHNDGRDHVHHFIIPDNTDMPKDKPIGEIQIEVISETIGQFSSLLDKTGKQIFEGDIVLGWRGYVPSDGYMRVGYPDSINVICVVEFNAGSFCKLKEIRPVDEHVDAAKMYNYRLNGVTLNPMLSGGHRYYNPVTKKHDIEGDGMTCPDVQIVGNIYENPELLIKPEEA